MPPGPDNIRPGLSHFFLKKRKVLMSIDAVTAVEAAIGARLDGARDQPFAVLDFDNTCIVNDIGEATLAFMCRNHLLRCGDLLPSGPRPCDPAYHEGAF